MFSQYTVTMSHILNCVKLIITDYNISKINRERIFENFLKRYKILEIY